MWQYIFAHSCYHMSRWFPQNNRRKINLFLILLAILLPVPQIYILYVADHTRDRYCSQPLLQLSIASLVFTFFSIGFVILFLLMIPVHRGIKICFHVFGIIVLIHGICMIVFTYWADDCYTTTFALYVLCVCGSWLSAASIAFLVIMFPFWLINKIKTDVILDPYNRAGMCYEPVSCCSCLWHVGV